MGYFDDMPLDSLIRVEAYLSSEVSNKYYNAARKDIWRKRLAHVRQAIRNELNIIDAEIKAE